MSDQSPKKAETAQEALNQKSKKPTTAGIREAIRYFGGNPDRDKKTQQPTQKESAQKETSQGS